MRGLHDSLRVRFVQAEIEHARAEAEAAQKRAEVQCHPVFLWRVCVVLAFRVARFPASPPVLRKCWSVHFAVWSRRRPSISVPPRRR